MTSTSTDQPLNAVVTGEVAASSTEDEVTEAKTSSTADEVIEPPDGVVTEEVAVASFTSVAEGRVLHKRSISKKLMFVDIETSSSPHGGHFLNSTCPAIEAKAVAPNSKAVHSDASSKDLHKVRRLECVFKVGICGQDQMFKAQKTSDKIHVGDVIRVQASKVTNME